MIHQLSDHAGLIEGVQDAKRIQEMILSKLRKFQSAGLGDEGENDHPTWDVAHISLLREIRDTSAQLAEELVSLDRSIGLRSFERKKKPELLRVQLRLASAVLARKWYAIVAFFIPLRSLFRCVLYSAAFLIPLRS